MTALPLALSLSSSFTQVGALAAFAALVGIAVMSLLFFSQARELKRLREWADAEPERAAEREQRLSAAVALRIQRATAEVARPVARAASAAPPATKVAKEVPAFALLPAAPAIVGTGKATPEPTPAEEPRAEPAVQTPEPVSVAAENHVEERAPVLAAVAAAPAEAATGVETPRAPSPPRSPAAEPVRRGAPEAPPAPRRTPSRERTPGSPPPRRRTRNGPPPGPPFLREEARRGSRAPLLLVGAAVVAVVVVLVVVLGSGGSSPSANKGARANLTSSSTTTSQARHTSSTATQPSEASSPATNPAETRVVVLNATETEGLAHRLSGDLQQSGYALAEPLSGKPSAHSTSVVQYTTGHRTDAEHVAQTLEISQVQPLEASVGALATGATVIVIAGQDKSSAP